MDEKENEKIKPNYVIEPDLENKIKITKSDNGFFIEYFNELACCDDGPLTFRKQYVTIDEEISSYNYNINKDIENEILDEEKAMYKLLHFVKNHFGIIYSKHKPVNLVIEFEDLRKEFEGENTENLKLNLCSNEVEVIEHLVENLMLMTQEEIKRDPYIKKHISMDNINYAYDDLVNKLKSIKNQSINNEPISQLKEEGLSKDKKKKLEKLIEDLYTKGISAINYAETNYTEEESTERFVESFDKLSNFIEDL